METLLCRRFDLARSASRSLDNADPVVRHHLDDCERCQDVYETEQAIADALLRTHAPLPAESRRRIEALIAVQSGRVNPSPSGSWLVALAMAAAAVLCAAMLPAAEATINVPPAPAPAPTAQAPTPHRAQGEAISGLAHLVDRHRNTAPSDVPAAALVYETKLPHSLANQLLSQPESRTANWDGLPAATQIDDATLFVLDRSRVVIDPVLEEVLNDAGSITLQHGLHQLAIADRDDRLFVIIANPAGVESLAGGL